MRKFKHLASLDAVKLREMRPDYIPVTIRSIKHFTSNPFGECTLF